MFRDFSHRVYKFSKNSEGVLWSNFIRLVGVVDIFIYKRYMRYSWITLFLVIDEFWGAEGRGRPFCHFVTFWKHTRYFILLPYDIFHGMYSTVQ
jgi:hypothetical protein